MQTRGASKSAVAAASISRTRVATAAAATPSPSRSRKKPKTQSSGSRSLAFTTECNIREEMRSLIISCIHDSGENYSEHDIDTATIGGWCLIDGLSHCATASNGILLPMIKEHGPPSFYIDHIKNKKISTLSEDDSSGDASNNCYQSFRSLCQIVSGQQLAGNAAKTIWRRLLQVADATEENTSNLTPEQILSIVENGDVEADLRAPAGLSNAKCQCIIAISKCFRDGTLSDKILLGGGSNDDEVRSRLLGIKGLGPWSVDMFLLFQCQKSDILPIGDLAFRNGTRNLWGAKGQAKGGGLCQRKDKQAMEGYHQPFAPYRSISSYYMYKCSGMK